MHICKSCKSHSPAGARFCSWCGTVISGQESRAQSLTGLLPSQSLLNNGHYAQIKNYQLVQKVGQGGMGAVYKAQDLLLNKRVVAIKEMSQKRIAPSALSPETVQGVALPDNGQGLLLPRPVALYDRTR